MGGWVGGASQPAAWDTHKRPRLHPRAPTCLGCMLACARAAVVVLLLLCSQRGKQLLASDSMCIRHVSAWHAHTGITCALCTRTCTSTFIALHTNCNVHLPPPHAHALQRSSRAWRRLGRCWPALRYVCGTARSACPSLHPPPAVTPGSGPMRGPSLACTRTRPEQPAPDPEQPLPSSLLHQGAALHARRDAAEDL